jgi:segregation and condensation protein B
MRRRIWRVDKREVKGVIMSALFVAGEAVETDAFCELTGADSVEAVADELADELRESESGILLVRVGSKLQLCTNAKYAQYIRTLFAPALRESLTNSMMETLSIIAYRQPVTRAEIDDIRGVHSNYAVSALAERGLVKEAGRKDVLGRPALLATTDEFLRHFGIASLAELPEIDFDAPRDGQPALGDEDEPELLAFGAPAARDTEEI